MRRDEVFQNLDAAAVGHILRGVAALNGIVEHGIIRAWLEFGGLPAGVFVDGLSVAAKSGCVLSECGRHLACLEPDEEVGLEEFGEQLVDLVTAMNEEGRRLFCADSDAN